MTYPKISIITPSYNQGHYIEQTITSILEQGYPKLEYIIIDGGSNDNTIDIIKKYEKHISYWVSEKDKGQSDAINKGFKRSTGDIINWLNSDDYYEPGSLAHIASVFGDPNVMAYCGRSRVFSSNSERISPGTDVYPDNLQKTIGRARIDQPETFFRKRAIDALGLLNEGLHYVMDKDLWVRFLCQFGIENIVTDEKCLVHFRLHETSKTISSQGGFYKEGCSLFYTYALQNGCRQEANAIRALFDVKELNLANPARGLTPQQWKGALSYFLFYQALDAYAGNNYKKSRTIIKQVNQQELTTADAQHLKKIINRIHFVPKTFKRIWNRFNK